jgi:hypothetical protein
MTDLGYMIWLIATAIMTATVLTVGTLAAAGVFDRDPQERSTAPRPAAERDARSFGDSPRAAPVATRHHDHAA